MILYVFVLLLFFFIMIKYIKFYVDFKVKLLRIDKIYFLLVYDILFILSNFYVLYFVVFEVFFFEILKRLF